MNGPEKSIERVLAGLRDAEVPAGLESRILLAMEARFSENASRGVLRKGWHTWTAARPDGRGQGWRIAGGALAAGLVALIVFTASMRKASHVDGRRQSVGMVAASGSLAGVEKVVPRRLEPHNGISAIGTASRKAGLSSGDTGLSLSDTARSSRETGVEAHTVSQGAGEEEGVRGTSGANALPNLEALAMSEMLAPSRPAPPMPLTQQEKLMMRVLRHGAREEQLAMLDPAVRARDAQQSEAEFHSFFDPPPLNPNE